MESTVQDMMAVVSVISMDLRSNAWGGAGPEEREEKDIEKEKIEIGENSMVRKRNKKSKGEREIAEREDVFVRLNSPCTVTSAVSLSENVLPSSRATAQRNCMEEGVDSVLLI